MTSYAQDTIHRWDTNYFWPGDPAIYTSIYRWEEAGAFYADGYLRCFTPTPTIVYDIAVISNGNLIHATDNPYTDVCMKIYGQEGGNIFLLDSVRISKSMLDNAKKDHDYYYFEPEDLPQANIYKEMDSLLTFYFNHPVTVSDTFWVGYHVDMNTVTGNWEYFEARYSWGSYHPPFHHIIKAEENVPGWNPISDWTIQEGLCGPGIILSISQPDIDSIPPCPVPDKPEVIEAESGFASIRWAANSTVAGYEIAFGTDTLNPENNSIIETTSNVKFFSGLENNRYYAAWLRYKCHHHCYWHDTNTYSDWSEPLVFYLSDGNTEPEFIGGVLDIQMSIYPNPAKDEITIETQGVPMQQLELYDIQGRLLKRVSQMEDREKCRLSIESLPTGRYVVKAITPFGITTQSFVKQ